MYNSSNIGLFVFCSQNLSPFIDWLDYLSFALAPLELNDTEPVVVYAKNYLQLMSDLINNTDKR